MEKIDFDIFRVVKKFCFLIDLYFRSEGEKIGDQSCLYKRENFESALNQLQ